MCAIGARARPRMNTVIYKWGVSPEMTLKKAQARFPLCTDWFPVFRTLSTHFVYCNLITVMFQCHLSRAVHFIYVSRTK